MERLLDGIMITRLTIKGRFPSFNDYIAAERGNRRYGASMKRKETKRVAEAAKDMTAIENPVVIAFRWIEPNMRRDVDNIAFAHKFILDGLVSAGVLKGDSRKYVIGLQDEFPDPDPDNPRVEITIMEV